MQTADAKRLRELEAETAELMRSLAEAHLYSHALKDVFSIKPWTCSPGAKLQPG